MARNSTTRKLLVQSVLWIALPMGLVLTGAIVAGLLAYQQVVSSLLIDRDRQLAAISASQIGRTLGDQALVLQTALEAGWARLGTSPGVLNLEPEIAERFSCCMVITDPGGMPLAAQPAGWQPSSRPISEIAPFQAALEADQPVFSDVLENPASGREIVVLAVGLYDSDGRFAGVALAGMPLDDLPFSESVRGLTESDEEFAYLVDSSGRAIYHPDPQLLGQDLSDRPFVERVIAGETGGMVWTAASGERLVQGYAPVPGTDWGLIVREPWEVVVEPIRTLGAGMAVASLLVLGTVALFLGLGVRRILQPITQLARQIPRLASGASILAPPASGVQEIDLLTRTFERLAEQVEAYRAGLRRYLEAVTSSQENERSRISRELHDDTVQGLLAIQRAIELEQARTQDPALSEALARLQGMLDQTMQGVREISRDLRPMILEDLGLVPALRTLLERRNSDADFTVQMRVDGAPVALPAEHELALYRITQEALSNVRKHAEAQKVQVRLRFGADSVGLSIEDNGQGFEPPASLAHLAQAGNFGLMGIQERARAIGGELEIDTRPGRGTRLEVTIPNLSQ